MQIFGINIASRTEKEELLKKIIEALHIGQEEKDLYIISLDILNDTDFSIFFNTIMSQIDTEKIEKEYSIAPLTQQLI